MLWALEANGQPPGTDDRWIGIVDGEVRSLKTGAYLCTPTEWDHYALVLRKMAREIASQSPEGGEYAC